MSRKKEKILFPLKGIYIQIAILFGVVFVILAEVYFSVKTVLINEIVHTIVDLCTVLLSNHSPRARV